MRRCKSCGETFASDELVKSRRSSGGVAGLCLACNRKRRRSCERPFGIEATNHAVELAPDRAPAERLRAALEQQRDQGRPWRVAWPLALRVALDGLDPLDQIEWRRVFNATRGSWEGSFKGLDWPVASGPALALPDERDDDHAGVIGAQVAA